MKHRCLNCDIDFSEEEDKCPECGTDEWEEIEYCKCTKCDWTGDINSGDPCPECGADLEEYN